MKTKTTCTNCKKLRAVIKRLTQENKELQRKFDDCRFRLADELTKKLFHNAEYKTVCGACGGEVFRGVVYHKDGCPTLDKLFKPEFRVE